MIDDVRNDPFIHGFAVRCDSSNYDSMDTTILGGLHGNGMVTQNQEATSGTLRVAISSCAVEVDSPSLFNSVSGFTIGYHPQ